MKIAVFTNLYPPFARGGAEIVTAEVVKQLIKIGHQVTVITTAPKKALVNKKFSVSEESGAKVFRIYPLNLYYYLDAKKYPKIWRLFWHVNNIFNWHVTRRVKKILKDEGVTAVISANLMGLSFLLPALWRKMKLPVVQIMHDVQLLHPSGLFMWGKNNNGVAAWFYQTILKNIFGSPQAVIFPSEWLEREYTTRGFFVRSARVVKANPQLFVNSFDQAPDDSHGYLKLLYVGQAEEHKGLFWLIENLKNIYDKEFKIDLILMGETGDKKRVYDSVKDDKRFAVYERLSQDEVEAKYRDASLLVMPSLCLENSPLTIQRALSLGTPVLASRVGGVPELVSEDINGWMFEAGNGVEFKERLLKITPEQVGGMRKNIKENYVPVDIAVYCQELVSLLE